MALNIANRRAVKQEMLSDHLNVAKPVTPILDGPIIAGLHDKSCSRFIYIVLAGYGRVDILHVFLSSHVAYNHLLHYLARILWVCVNAIRALFLY